MTAHFFFPGLDDFRRRSFVGNPWFAGLPAPIIDTLVESARLRVLPSQGLLHARGDPPDGLYGVVSGAVRIGSTSLEGLRVAVAILGPGSWFGEMSMIDNQPRTHDAHACGPTCLLVVPGQTIGELIERDLQVFKSLARLVCHRLRTVYSEMEDQLFAPMPTRLARRLLMLAETYGADLECQIRLPLGQENIAAMLGVTRQSANTILRNFEKKNLVQLGYGWIWLKDIAGLRNVAAAN
jgi:CRP-like cAMP-binding protein